MKRRSVIGLAAATLLPGCSYSEQSSTDAENPHWVSEFVTDLEAKGIRVDSTLSAGGDLSLMYFHRPEKHEQDITRVATTFSEYADNVRSLLTVTAINPDGDSRHGGWVVEKEWATAYRSGDLSKSQYMTKVEDTYKSYE